MVINVAHASDQAILQTVEASRDPVIYSHGGFRGVVDNPRCITDEAAKALAAKGGVIGIQFGSTFNNPKYASWIKSTARLRLSRTTAEVAALRCLWRKSINRSRKDCPLFIGSDSR